MVFFLLLACNVYCDAKQNIDTLLHPNILNDNVFAQNELIDNQINFTQPAVKDTVSQEPLLKRPKICFHVALDTVVLPGINIGYGWIIYDSTSTSEEIVTLHFNTIKRAKVLGIFFQLARFRNADRSGWFGLWKFGLDYGFDGGLLDFVPAESNSSNRSKPSIFLNISLGGGYSFKIAEESYFRIAGDVGFKMLFASLTFSFVF